MTHQNSENLLTFVIRTKKGSWALAGNGATTETFPSLSKLVAYYSACTSPAIGLRLVVPGAEVELAEEQPTSPFIKVTSSVTLAKHVRTPIKRRAPPKAVLSLTPYVNSDSDSEDQIDPDATYNTADADNDSDASF